MNPQMLQEILLLAIPVIVAITFHEAAHGYVALYCGDETAKNAGRVTLNPLKHIDLVGTIILPLLLIMTAGFMFGYAKPVPVNFAALKHPRRDMILVAAAGPGMNMLLAVVSGLFLNLYLAWRGGTDPFVADLLRRSVSLNVMLAIFNLLPLPPLDGSKVVAPLLPASLARAYLGLERFGMLILLLLLFVVPILAERNGTSFDIFGPLVLRPANEVTRFILSLTGNG